MLVEALVVLSVTPVRALYVGDMEVDVETGRRAGCAVALVATGAQGVDELRRHDAEIVLEKLVDLPARIG